MAFWQENYQFIKEVYEMRHSKMAEWMENVEKVCLQVDRFHEKIRFSIIQAISRIMADKVYTSAEFKRERDTFNVRKLSTFFIINFEILVPLQRS